MLPPTTIHPWSIATRSDDNGTTRADVFTSQDRPGMWRWYAFDEDSDQIGTGFEPTEILARIAADQALSQDAADWARARALNSVAGPSMVYPHFLAFVDEDPAPSLAYLIGVLDGIVLSGTGLDNQDVRSVVDALRRVPVEVPDEAPATEPAEWAVQKYRLNNADGTYYEGEWVVPARLPTSEGL